MKILMVCLGNICRSPLAEGIMKAKLPENFVVDSAGTSSQHEGEHPDKRSIEAARNHGFDISKQKSRPITAEDLENFDKIFCMDLSNFKDVLSMAKNEAHREKISMILVEAGEHSEAEVPDPYWGGEDDFEAVYLMLDKACSIVANKILDKK